MSKNYIVGFHSGHDCSYCVLEDGEIVVHEELERATRIKEGIGDGLRYFYDRNKDIASDISYFTHCHHAPGVRGLGSVELFDKMVEQATNLGGGFSEISHHLAHAAHAFYSSKQDKALIITVDAGGWNYTKNGSTVSSVTIWRGNDKKIEPVDIYQIDQFNIGGIWAETLEPVFGLSSGPPKGNQAGTIMAMAAIGKEPAFAQEIYAGFTNPFLRHSLLARMKKYHNEHEDNKYSLARGIQEATEQIFHKLLKKYLKKDDTNLCFSGGVTLNSVCMGKVWEWFPQLKDIYVPIAPYDGGLAIGAAQYIYHHIQENPRIAREDHIPPYLGVTYTSNDVENALRKYEGKLVVEKDKTDSDVTSALTEEKIIAIFNGKSESGRRALGNRSIIADPRSPRMKDLLNEKVKHRQWFRPFAPSILAEETKNWFVRDIESPYMGFVIPFKEEMKSKVPAVVHLDGTGRLQTVTEKVNPWYYNFIKRWFNETGVPIVLNTSFNDREPIVETPENAIECFLKTKIDYLYFPEYNILAKKK